MTPLCASCRAPLGDDAVVCVRCMGGLEQALAETPAVVQDVEIMLARQATRVDVMGTPTANDEEARTLDRTELGVAVQKLPYDGGASVALGHLRAVLVSWVRMYVEETATSEWPNDTLAAMARFLQKRLEWLRHHEAAGEAVEEVTDAVSGLLAVADRHTERWYVGDCRTEDCREAVYCAAGSTWAECPSCHALYDVATCRDEMFAKLVDSLGTAEECALAVSHTGRLVRADRIRQWAKRGRIEDCGPKGQPKYRIRDVIDLLDAADTREAG